MLLNGHRLMIYKNNRYTVNLRFNFTSSKDYVKLGISGLSFFKFCAIIQPSPKKGTGEF